MFKTKRSVQVWTRVSIEIADGANGHEDSQSSPGNEKRPGEKMKKVRLTGSSKNDF